MNDQGGGSAALSIAPADGTRVFAYFDPHGRTWDPQGEPWLSSNGTVRFQRTVPETISLLFAVAQDSERLYLQIADTEKIPVPPFTEIVPRPKQ